MLFPVALNKGKSRYNIQQQNSHVNVYFLYFIWLQNVSDIALRVTQIVFAVDARTRFNFVISTSRWPSAPTV